MSRAEIIDTVVRFEWEDVIGLRMAGGGPACENNPDTFSRLRRALLETWSEELLESYLGDLAAARSSHRSLAREKYAWMGEGADDRAFVDAAPMLPLLPYETCERIERILKFLVLWQAQAMERFPRVTAGGRPLVTEDDRDGLVSIETYRRAELRVCSPRTIELYEAYVLECWHAGTNLAIAYLDNVARSYGYRGVCDAESGGEPPR